jgi:hypothetical protein
MASKGMVWRGPGQKLSLTKQPSEILIRDVDMGPYLNGTTTVTSTVTSVLPVGPTVTQMTQDGDKTPVKIVGGTDGYSGVIKVMVTCANTEVYEVEIDLDIKEVA